MARPEQRRRSSGYCFLCSIFLPGVLVLAMRFRQTDADQVVERFLEVVSHGDLPLYLIPLQVAVGVILCVVAVRRVKRDTQVDLGSILSWRSLVLLGICCCMSVIYLDYVSHAFTEMQMYGVERTSQAWNNLKTFLVYGHLSGPEKLWGYIYPAQVNSDITFYVGLIPLVFVAFALSTSVRSAYFMAVVMTGGVLVCFAHAYYTFIAPLAYVLIPGMSYYRHLAWSMGATKIFLLVAAGFGVDGYLDSFRDPVEFAKATRILTLISASLLGMVLFFDLVMFHFRAPFVGTGIDLSPLDDAIPMVHYAALLALIVFVAGAAAALWGWVSGTMLARAVLGLYLVNIGAYHLTMAYYTPGVEAGRPSVVVNMPTKPGEKERHFREAFLTRQYGFQYERVHENRFVDVNPYINNILGYRGVKYSYLYSAFQVDPCLPVAYRSDFVPLALDRLLRARLGFEIDTPVDRLGKSFHWQDMLKMLSADDQLMKSIGCDSLKLRVASAVHVVTSLSEAVEYIRDTPDIDEVPVILSLASPENCRNGGIGKGLTYLERTANARINVLRFSANSLELIARVSTKSEHAWLIYLDTYHSGWRAMVNGRPTEIAMANLAFKAVPLEPGENHVQLVFRGYGGRTAIFGIIIFVFAAIGALAIVGWSIYLLIPGLFSRSETDP